MGSRRVVTGQNKDGKAVIVSDEEVEAGTRQTVVAYTSLWGADAPPSFPNDGKHPQMTRLFPGPGGYRFFTWTLAPNSISAPTPEELKKLPPDVQAHLERDEPGMHTSDSVDLEIVLAGEASVELDDGAVVHLKVGDFLVQNGTRHRWFNRGSVPTTVCGVIIGGNPRHKH